MNFQKEYENKRQVVNEFIEKLFPPSGEGPPLLREAMRYSLLAGGKRLRPILVISAYESLNGEDIEKVMPIAVGVEFIHTFTLIHDDLPALDNDDLRRGKPTNHKVFGEAMAILAGDALFAESLNIMLKARLKPETLLHVLEYLFKEIGVYGVIGGQVLDILAEQKRECSAELVKEIHLKKTASFIKACMVIGGIAAVGHYRNEKVRILEKAGEYMGLAFQIIDDILDETSTPEELGKTPKKDWMANKCTWVKVFGIERAREDAKELIKNAIEELNKLENSEFLKALAEFIVKRKN